MNFINKYFSKKIPNKNLIFSYIMIFLLFAILFNTYTVTSSPPSNSLDTNKNTTDSDSNTLITSDNPKDSSVDTTIVDDSSTYSSSSSIVVVDSSTDSSSNSVVVDDNTSGLNRNSIVLVNKSSSYSNDSSISNDSYSDSIKNIYTNISYYKNIYENSRYYRNTSLKLYASNERYMLSFIMKSRTVGIYSSGRMIEDKDNMIYFEAETGIL